MNSGNWWKFCKNRCTIGSWLVISRFRIRNLLRLRSVMTRLMSYLLDGMSDPNNLKIWWWLYSIQLMRWSRVADASCTKNTSFWLSCSYRSTLAIITLSWWACGSFSMMDLWTSITFIQYKNYLSVERHQLSTISTSRSAWSWFAAHALGLSTNLYVGSGCVNEYKVSGPGRNYSQPPPKSIPLCFITLFHHTPLRTQSYPEAN